VLGKPGEHDTEHAILAEYGLPSEFPEVETFATKIDTSITANK
jgi:hypothetical protein